MPKFVCHIKMIKKTDVSVSSENTLPPISPFKTHQNDLMGLFR